jgi:hypothetical protein
MKSLTIIKRFFFSTLIATLSILMTSDHYSAHSAAFVKWECVQESQTHDCLGKQKVKYIYIYDEIDYQTMAVVNVVNQSTLENQPFPLVYLNSPGGNIDEAMNIGRILRARSASVESLDVFHPDNTPMCNSACSIIAAGATNRNLYEIGFHRGFNAKRLKGEKYKYTEMSNEEMEPVVSYLNEMKISQEVINLIKETPANKIYELYLSLDEPFLNQKIVKYGFRTREPLGEERARLLKLTLLRDDGRNGLEAAAALDDAYAAYTLGRRLVEGTYGYERDIKRGLEYLEISAKLDNAYALHELGVIYRDGVEGVKINNKKAFAYFLRAAKRGLAASQNNAGWMLYEGEGTSKNISEAIYWLTNAVNQGEAFAYGSLGTVRYEGNGFIKDDIETYKLLRLATLTMPNGKAKQDEMRRLQSLKSRMSKVDIYQAELLAKRWKPLTGYTTSMRDKDDR